MTTATHAAVNSAVAGAFMPLAMAILTGIFVFVAATIGLQATGMPKRRAKELANIIAVATMGLMYLLFGPH